MKPEDSRLELAPNIVPVEQARLWEAYWADPKDLLLRNQLAEMNSGLVGWTLGTIRYRGSIEEEELKVEGWIGLLRAVELYDPTKGFAFSTYAPHWIRQAITRHVGNTASIIRVPIHVGEMAHHLRRADNAFFTQEGRFPTDAEMAEFLGFPVESITEMRVRSTPAKVTSLDQSLGDHYEQTYVDVLADPATDVFEEVALRGSKANPLGDAISKFAPEGVDVKTLKDAFDQLPERTRLMVVLSASDQTLEQIGSRFGVTRERARQVIAKALRELRKVFGVDPSLPVGSIRIGSRGKEIETDAIQGITPSILVGRVKEVVEEIKTYGRSVLRLPPSVHVRKRRQRPSGDIRVTREPRMPRARVVRPPIMVTVVSTKKVLKPEREPEEVVIASLSAPVIKRVHLNEREFELAEQLWKQMSQDVGGTLDFAVAAENLKVSLTKVHLTSCALIAKGVIKQDKPGCYRQGKNSVVLKAPNQDPVEVDFQYKLIHPAVVAPEQIQEQQVQVPDILESPRSDLDAEIARLEQLRETVVQQLAVLRAKVSQVVGASVVSSKRHSQKE